MNKKEFLEYLKRKLRSFGEENAADAISYYDEIIDDKIKDGMTEEEAVASIGSLDSVAADTVADMVANKKTRNTGNAAFVLIGICLTPVLFPLAIALFCVYVTVFAVWISLTAGFGATAGGLIIGGFAAFAFTDVGTALITAGICLVVGAVFAVLTVLIGTFGWQLLNLITVKFGRAVKNKLDTKKD